MWNCFPSCALAFRLSIFIFVKATSNTRSIVAATYLSVVAKRTDLYCPLTSLVVVISPTLIQSYAARPASLVIASRIEKVLARSPLVFLLTAGNPLT